MISKTEMLSGLDKIHYRVIDTLADWMARESQNLLDFVNNPSGHVEYNPYIVPDYTALNYRINTLRQSEEGLRAISGFKKGDELYTRGQHDALFEELPLQLFDRLFEWIEKRTAQMEEMIASAKKPSAGTSEYEGLYTFNQAKFYSEYMMYKNSRDGLNTLIQYRNENVQTATEEQSIISEIPEEGA